MLSPSAVAETLMYNNSPGVAVFIFYLYLLSQRWEADASPHGRAKCPAPEQAWRDAEHQRNIS